MTISQFAIAKFLDDESVSVLSPSARFVLCDLGSFAGKKINCFPSQETLSKRTGLSLPTVKRAIASLVKFKIIFKERKRKGRGLIYEFHEDFIARWFELSQIEKNRHIFGPEKYRRIKEKHLWITLTSQLTVSCVKLSDSSQRATNISRSFNRLRSKAKTTTTKSSNPSYTETPSKSLNSDAKKFFNGVDSIRDMKFFKKINFIDSKDGRDHEHDCESYPGIA